MRRARKIVLWTLGVVVVLPIVLVALVAVAANTDPGRRLIERQAESLTGGMVRLSGLSGRFPDALRIGHAELRDATGAWVIIDEAALDWTPSRLLSGDAAIQRLQVGRIQVPRLAAASPSQPAASGGEGFSLPIKVSVEHLAVGRLDIGAPVAGVAAAVTIDGHATLASLSEGEGEITINRLDGPGHYAVSGRLDARGIRAKLDATEPTHGLVASVAALPDLGDLSLAATIDGPRSAEVAALTLHAGPLQAEAHGTIDLDGKSFSADVTASAPAMAPRADTRWNAVAVNAHASGPFTRPDATAHIAIEALEAGGATIRSLIADVSGNAGRVGLRAAIDGLRIPGPSPDLLEAAPLRITGDIQLDAPSRPVQFGLHHPLMALDGTAETGGDLRARLTADLPQLAPFAAIGGVDLRGGAHIVATASAQGETTVVGIDGTVGVTGGLAPIPGLIGEAAKLSVAARLHGSDLTVSKATVDGKTLRLAANGSDIGGRLDLTYHVGLADLSVLAPTIAGALQVDGTAKGGPADLAIDARGQGEVAASGVPRGPLRFAVSATGLPGAPAGTISAEGSFDGAPIQLDASVTRTGDGTLHAALRRADWKSAHADADVTLAPGSTLPQGTVNLRMARLDELRRLAGQAVSGSIETHVTLTGTEARVMVEARQAGIPGTSVGRVSVSGHVSNPATHPSVALNVIVDGLQANGIGGSARVDANGPQEALVLKAQASLRNVSGGDAQVTTQATVDAMAKRVALAAFQATWKGQTVRLLAPARVSFADGVAVDRLRIGLQQATVDVAGRLSPTLDVTVALRNVTADLAKAFAPDLAADGVISGDAKLTGTPAAPAGTIRLTATGMHLRTGPGRSLPPANLNATATLAGRSARLDARLTAGTTSLAVNGTAPLAPTGALSLRATGGLDLALLDPILSASGRRVRGKIDLDAAIAGTVAAPQVNGSIRLAGAEVQDFAQGVRITDIAATIQAAGDTVRIASLTGKAGTGTISAGGTIGVSAPGMPIDITLTARNARPLASDRLTADLDADLAIRGQVQGRLAASGKVRINHADINIPEHLPASVAVLDVRRPGQAAPRPTVPGNPIALDLTLDAPNQIFVRGRGLDAELGGTLTVKGTSTAPLVAGGFEMRRGVFSLAGTTLNFVRGKVGFDGVGVTNAIDPTLDFEADSATASVTAKLLVTGHASKPVITLSSTPDLPQDEVLAHLLFQRSAKELGPFQIAEIGAALADLSGTTSGASNPLDSVRRGLGLDRLQVGGGNSGSTPSVEAGRYIADGVYIGAKQGTSGGGTQATVQIDITRGLKLQTDIGTGGSSGTGAAGGSGGSNVGVTYQFEY